MADYLKIFKNQADYDEYIESGYPKPNVSYIEDTDETIFTNYQDGEAGPDAVVVGISPEDWPSSETNFSLSKSVREVYIPDGVTTIGMRTFNQYTALTSVTIPDSVTSIGDQTFAGCTSLTSVTIGRSVSTIPNNAFLGCSGLTSVTIPNSVNSIGNQAFADCSGLTSVTIPNSVTRIGSHAFNGCSAMTSVTIGNSITSISYAAFNNCTSLASFTVRATTPPTLDIAFQFASNTFVIYVPAESVDAYKAASGWSTYASRIQAIPA